MADVFEICRKMYLEIYELDPAHFPSDIKYLGEYHDFYLKSDTQLLADVFEICRKMYLEIYQLDPAHFPIYQY